MKLKGLLVSSIFILVVLAIAYRVTFIRNLVMGSSAA